MTSPLAWPIPRFSALETIRCGFGISRIGPPGGVAFDDASGAVVAHSIHHQDLETLLGIVVRQDRVEAAGDMPPFVSTRHDD